MSAAQFEQVYLSNEQSLRSYAWKLAQNKMDADDLVQEAALKAYKNFHKFVDGGNFKSWAFTIIRNTFFTHYKKRTKQQVINVPVEDMMFAVDCTTPIIFKDSSNGNVKKIKQHINSLSSKSKVVFNMYLSGYDYSEIAEDLQIPIGTVKSRINFARTKLKAMINEKK